jgi:hypothetical protein
VFKKILLGFSVGWEYSAYVNDIEMRISNIQQAGASGFADAPCLTQRLSVDRKVSSGYGFTAVPECGNCIFAPPPLPLAHAKIQFLHSSGNFSIC